MNRRKPLKITALLAGSVILFLVGILILNLCLTNLIDKTNEECPGQRFASVAEAMQGMTEAADPSDTSLDYSPSYELLCSVDYDEFTVVLYSYAEASDDECAVRLLKKNGDGTVSFVGGFTDFLFSVPESNPDYYYYTNVKTSHGLKTVSFLYLPGDSTASLYVDGYQAEKIKVNIGKREFYLCAALSGKDTFLKNLFVPIDRRHTVTIG